MKEIWKGVIYQGKDYSKRLEVSNLGKLRNTKNKRICNQHINKNGYFEFRTTLGSEKNMKTFKIHKCVAETFIENCNNYPIVNHIDGNKLNNYVKNLEWCTYSHNNKHAIDLKLRNYESITGTNNAKAKLTKKDIIYIRNHYIPKSRKYGSMALAKKFNVSDSTILLIIKRKRYKNIL